ncbi:hypothetical protein MMC21_008163 [Puttea exsequens]|nr:hypothetical protein [Puttea exsequens]
MVVNPSFTSHEAYAKTGLLVTERPASDETAASTSSPNEKRHRKPTLINSFGYYIIATTIGGTTVIAAAFAFVCFLHIGNSDNSTWRSIMIAGWSARSITLASLAIRFVVTAQAAAATSMLAALALSRFEVPLWRSAAMSMMRFENTGPHNLARIYAPKILRGKNIILGLAALCLTCTTLLLQFASTALLSDLAIGTIVGASRTAAMPYGIKNSGDGNDETEPLENSAHYWSTKPALYPAFAEYTEPAPPVEEGVYDTGMSIRAFLPVYPEADRDRLKDYQGFGNLVDTRIVCMRPVIEDLELTAPPGTGASATTSAEYTDITDMPELPGDGGPTVTGSLYTNLTARRSVSDNSLGSDFNCSSAIQGAENSSRATMDEWPAVLCLLDTLVPGAIVSDMDGYDELNTGDAYLVINTTGSYDDWDNLYGESDNSSALDVESTKDEGEWLTYNLKGTNLTLSFSVCFSAFTAQNANISATSLRNRTEPVLGWDPSTSQYDTLSVRQHLGATNLDPAAAISDRADFQLAPLANWTVPTTSGLAPTWGDFPVTLANEQWFLKVNYTMVLCGHCRPTKDMGGVDFIGEGEFADQAQAAVFNDILKTTRHPALAIQAQFTTLFGMAYYDHAFQFDISAPATTTSFTDVLMPVQWTGVIAVAAVLALHLCVVFVVVIWFRIRVEESLLGNAWTVVAQLQSEKAKKWLEKGDMASDKELVREMKRGLRGEMGLVGVKRLDGRVMVVGKED